MRDTRPASLRYLARPRPTNNQQAGRLLDRRSPRYRVLTTDAHHAEIGLKSQLLHLVEAISQGLSQWLRPGLRNDRCRTPYEPQAPDTMAGGRPRTWDRQQCTQHRHLPTLIPAQGIRASHTPLQPEPTGSAQHGWPTPRSPLQPTGRQGNRYIEPAHQPSSAEEPGTAMPP